MYISDIIPYISCCMRFYWHALMWNIVPHLSSCVCVELSP